MYKGSDNMFTLSEIKEIRRNYQIDDNGNIIFNRLNNKDNKNGVKFPNELSLEENIEIKSALFLYKIFRTKKAEPLFKNFSDEDFVTEMQSKFIKDALARTEYQRATIDFASESKMEKLIWTAISNREYGSMEYFIQSMSENGKNLKNVSIDDGKTGGYTIQYSLENKPRNKFVESLQNQARQEAHTKSVATISPEVLARRKVKITQLLEDYGKIETDEQYQVRLEKEDKNMQRVANIINNNLDMLRINDTDSLFRLLKAAQNLSIEGQKDYLVEIIQRPEVNDFLVQLYSPKGQSKASEISKQAKENENNGLINSNGLFGNHSLSQGEKELHSANVCVRNNPQIIAVITKKISSQTQFTFGKTTDDNRLSNLYSLISRTQGKIPNKTRKLDSVILDTGDSLAR